jgi:DNA invertase Pin-like site-specific DNA recombinase
LVGIVAVSKIGRLSRSATDFAKLVEVFDRNGESLFSLKQTASGAFLRKGQCPAPYFSIKKEKSGRGWIGNTLLRGQVAERQGQSTIFLSR